MEDFKLIEEKENPLFKRREIEFSVNVNITPSNAEVGKFISEKFSAPLETIKIKKISGRFGSHSFIVTTNVYASKEDKESIERKSKKDDALKPVEEKPSEELEQEATSEEKTESQKSEAKPQQEIPQSSDTVNNSNKSSEPKESEQSKE